MSKLIEKLKPGLRPLPPDVQFGNINILVATWFGVGRLQPASGTIGSLAAIPFGYAIDHFLGIPGLILSALALAWIGTIAAGYYGRKSGQKDDQAIVVDEVVGMWIAGIPAEGNFDLWIVAFLLFRIFDIYKPWPASFFEKRRTGPLDVMMDDVVAGLYAVLGVASVALFYTA